jgi:Uma2 family endonuclease
MAAMSGRTASAEPPTGLPFGRPLTVDDLVDLPEDDGHRYELIDGVLLVSPAPIWGHQAALGALYRLLHAACPRELRVVGAPFDWRESRHTKLQPDILVTRFAALAAIEGGRYLLEPPLLAVEVLSPSTLRFDRLTKLSVYEDAGVAGYWLVDPDPDRPALTVFELDGGRYAEAAHVTGSQPWAATWPFAVTVRPDELLADLRP